MRSRTQLTKKAQLWRQKFTARFNEWLLSVGGVIVDTREHTDGSRANEFELQTRVGLLTVRPYNTWLACRFEDPKAAAAVLGYDVHARLNPHSGKWNFNYNEDNDIELCLEHFKYELKAIYDIPTTQ